MNEKEARDGPFLKKPTTLKEYFCFLRWDLNSKLKL